MDQPKPPRGWVSLYAAALVLMLVAGALLVVASVGTQFASLRLMRFSAWCSAAAIVVAVVSVLAPRRR